VKYFLEQSSIIYYMVKNQLLDALPLYRKCFEKDSLQAGETIIHQAWRVQR